MQDGPSRPRHRARAQAGSAGLTLVELMVVVAILALMVMAAVPALTKDDIESRFFNYVERFSHDLRRCSMEAISSRDHRRVVITSSGYDIEAVVRTSSGGETATLLARRTAPPGVVIAGVLGSTALPGTSYSAPSSMSGSVLLRFKSTGGLAIESGSNTVTDSSASIFFEATGGKYRARVVVYQATCQVRMYDRW